MDRLCRVLEERNIYDKALLIGQDAFANLYRYILRFTHSYNETAHKAMFTLVPTDTKKSNLELDAVSEGFAEMLQNNLRKSDIMMKTRSNQYFVLLPQLAEEHAQNVIQRIMKKWDTCECHDSVRVIVDIRAIKKKGDRRLWSNFLI